MRPSVRRAGSHSGWTPIPLGDRVALGTIMVLGLLVMLAAVVGLTALAGWLLLDML